ncbi:MAG: phenylalanine--tRNA ligase subunit beta, partial [Bacteroidetes bacterium]
MKISYNWLKDFIDIDLSVEQTANLLTNSGLEVENVEFYESIKGGLKGLIVGEVIEKKKHPNADKLSLTKVDIGNGTMLSIVCGAPNVDAGQKVIVATVGTTLHPVSGEPFTIKKSKIRGEISEGMICAEDEIGVGYSHDGIIVLPQDTPAGMPAADIFKVYTDYVLEIGLTPNRADAMSHWGVSRDLKAVIHHKLNTDLTLQLPDTTSFKTDNNDFVIDIEVENQEACPRYCGLTITGVQVKESPQWLKNRLQAIGVRPINNIVDATNYVLHELGQPLHAFDADKIAGKKVIVKTVKEGTSFVTLDGIERKLSSKDLMICDAEKPMTIAGVFGGLNSGVSENTVNIFLESAYFNPVWIRKTAKRHGLSTDASFRFERGIDPNITVYALKRAALLIQEIAGGKVSMDIKDTHPSPFPAFKVAFSPRRAQQLIGKTIEENTMESILSDLEIKIEKQNECWNLEVPPYRVDVQREADVVEEILRIYGFNEIETPEKFAFTPGLHDKFDKNKIENTISDLLSSNGFMQIMNNSLTNRKYYDYVDNQYIVKILNPISSELSIMRQNLLFGALESISANLKRQKKNLKFYAFG